jgi:PAS domain S-box-containing protein
MGSRRSVAIFSAAGIGILVLSGIYLGVIRLRSHIDDRVYLIGWQDVPPFQQKAEDGLPAGLAVELVRDAARRRGIRLKWVWHPGSSEAALRNREVDLWPLITITPERRGVIHISKPYLQHEFTLLVLATSSYSQAQDLASATISYPGRPFSQQVLHRILPHARMVSAASQKDAVESVCARSADAAFLDEFTAEAVLLSGLSCLSQPMRVIPLPMLRSILGVGSTLEASAVADEIRRGIDASVREGNLARILTSWGYLSRRNMEYFSAALDAQRREQWLMAIIAVFAALLALTAFGSDRIRRQRNRIKAAERALRHSEEQLRLLTNNLSDMVMAYDMDRRLVFGNPAVERLTGYSVADLQNGESVRWVHPDDRSRMLESWERLFQGVDCRDKEYRLITKDRQAKWITASGGPIYDDGGRQVGVQAIARDITERKLAAEALRESERRFRELLERVQLVAVMTDLNGKIAFCNDYTLAITGWTSEEVIGQPAREFLDPEFPPHSAQEVAIATSAARTQQFFEGKILAKNGSRKSIRWSSTVLRDSEGRAAGFASLGEDVTELQALRAEAARREGEERFRNIADTAPLMIWVTAPDKGCTFVNKGWLSFTGHSLEQELGNGWAAGIHPDDLESCLSTYAAAFDARRDFQMEHRLRRADGEYRWLLCSGVPRFGPDGEFTGYVGNCSDITDLKHSRDEDVARQKLESVGTLAGGVAHDFNNLLGAVLAQADVALTELAAGASPAEQLNHIRAVAIRGAGIVRQLMIYAGQETAVSEPIDISWLIDDMMELLKVVVSKRAVLKTELVGGLPAVLANPAQLRQMVMNLVTNASEAIGERDGVIAIRTALAKAGHEPLRDSANGYVELEVSDTGCGISHEAQTKIFDPFFTTKPTGHGLGLAVVARIVRGLGGASQFESEPGRGTTFRILLPSVRDMAPVPRPANASPAHGTIDPARIVLVVEDEEPLRLAVAKMLRRNGVSVMEAEDGTAALGRLREHGDQIGLVLLDITLPGAPSREVFAEARRRRPDMKVILTSAYGQKTVDETFQGMEIDAFIRKPYQLGELVSLVRNLVSTESAAAVDVSANQIAG